jgi:hypothetical protein
MNTGPITESARSKAWTFFAHSNAGIVGSNPTQDMDVCVCVYFVFVLSCVQVAALWRTDPPYKESYRLCKKYYETKEEGERDAWAQYRAVQPLMNKRMNECMNIGSKLKI